jgi:biopolymer transport protein ExbB/TolQ
MSHLKVEFPPEERATTAVNIWLVMLGASILTLICFTILYFSARFGKLFLRELFMGFGWAKDKNNNDILTYSVNTERVIFQFLTLWMFFLSIMNIVLKFGKLRKESKMLMGDWVPQDMNMRDLPSLLRVHERLMALPDLHERVSLMRMARILSMWINTEDLGRVQAYAKQETEMDIYVSDSSYKSNRLYIWAMPLLGFVGTVYGVSAGIGGFADFLKGQVTSDMIKVQVGLITEGLAVAFYCTLLGLVTAGIAAFPSLGAEKKEEEVLSGIDEYVEDRLLSRMPSSAESLLPADDITAMRRGIERMSGEKSMDAIVNAIREIKIDFPMDQLSKAIEDGFKRFPNPEKFEEVFVHAIGSAHDLIKGKYEEFAKSYETRIGDLGVAFAAKLGGVAERFETGTSRVAEQLVGQANAINTVGSQQLQALSTFGTQQLQSLGTAQQNIVQSFEAAGSRNVEAIAAAHQNYAMAITNLGVQETAKWQAMSSEFRQLSAQLGQQFQSATTQLAQAAAQYSQRVDESSQALAAQMGRVVEIGSRIDQLLNASRAMETAFVNLGTGREFGETLTTLRSHLTASDDLLKRLSKPRTIVLQEQSAE